MKPTTFVGIDLTDPFSRACRQIDVALVSEDGAVSFDLLPWKPHGHLSFPEIATEISNRYPRDSHFLVIDGPQSLALPGNNHRECDALTRTPARSPDQLPEADGRPFAGYLRGSILLWRELLNCGWEVAEELNQVQSGRMAEAFPGDAWRRLSPHRLPSKSTTPGRRARQSLLGEQGLTFPTAELPTHDQLDAAICAALGIWARDEEAVLLVGEPLREEGGHLREGYILSPVPVKRTRDSSSQASHLRSQPPAPAKDPATATTTPRRPAPPGLGPDEVWVYFAHDVQADQANTFEIIEEESVLWRPALNTAGQAIANLRRLRPGDPIVVAHGNSMLGAFLGAADGVSLLPFQDLPHCVAEVPANSPLRERFRSAGYADQAVLTVLVLEEVRALTETCDVPRQTGRNALQRAVRPDLLRELALDSAPIDEERPPSHRSEDNSPNWQ